jgi:hypothetical protein
MSYLSKVDRYVVQKFTILYPAFFNTNSEFLGNFFIALFSNFEAKYAQTAQRNEKYFFKNVNQNKLHMFFISWSGTSSC